MENWILDRFLNGTLSLSSALGSMIIRTMDQSVDSKSLCIVNLKVFFQLCCPYNIYESNDGYLMGKSIFFVHSRVSFHLQIPYYRFMNEGKTEMSIKEDNAILSTWNTITFGFYLVETFFIFIFLFFLLRFYHEMTELVIVCI